MIDTVKFNVGGHHYQISCALLEKFPDSVLARRACEYCADEPNSEVFIDRDGTTFRYVLNYLRDGEVSLPASETKEGLLNELSYFGIPTATGFGLSSRAQEQPTPAPNANHSQHHVLARDHALNIANAGDSNILVIVPVDVVGGARAPIRRRVGHPVYVKDLVVAAVGVRDPSMHVTMAVVVVGAVPTFAPNQSKPGTYLRFMIIPLRLPFIT
eukprot:CAMPEP_0197238124 /NCGR_PEP_ID=MMETSP1429-20130617/4716_1 /TAXON_ID=49237 /ORGANISM="Chaetoceros  sp., Strain UNC1202" /LENGTH=212 /DNA_ID=CAMNT_0042697227 /DNA_START=136 /DNA_END=775 /DNA_ORIENTATION=-